MVPLTRVGAAGVLAGQNVSFSVGRATGGSFVLEFYRGRSLVISPALIKSVRVPSDEMLGLALCRVVCSSLRQERRSSWIDRP